MGRETGNRGFGRGPQRLTEKQERLLDAARQADDAWRTAKLTLKARLRRELERELMRYSQARDKAVYEAVEADVPKTRLASEALRTSPNAVYDAVSRHAELLDPNLPEVPETPVERFVIHTYDHDMPGAVVYVLVDSEHPHPSDLERVGLSGQVDGWILPRMKTGWAVLQQPQDMPDDTWDWWLRNRPEQV